MSVDVVERVRMAVAEAGYNPADINVVEHPVTARTLGFGLVIPWDVAWRAYELAGVHKPICACCAESTYGITRNGGEPPGTCVADRRFMEDCGAERPS